MATDVFGDSSLFDEFEKDRLPESSYLKKETEEPENDKDKSIVFKADDFESDSEDSSDFSDTDEQQQQNNEKKESNVDVISEDGKRDLYTNVEDTLDVNGTDKNCPLTDVPGTSGSSIKCESVSKLKKDCIFYGKVFIVYELSLISVVAPKYPNFVLYHCLR